MAYTHIGERSIEEIIKEHVIRMKSIPGNSDYDFDKYALFFYLCSIESKAASPPVIQHSDMRNITLGTVYGKS